MSRLCLRSPTECLRFASLGNRPVVNSVDCGPKSSHREAVPSRALMFAGWKKLDGWARKKLGRRVHSLPDRTAVNCLLESLIDQCRESGLTLPPNFGAAELRTRTRAWMGDNGDVVLDGDWREVRRRSRRRAEPAAQPRRRLRRLHHERAHCRQPSCADRRAGRSEHDQRNAA